MVEVVEVEVLEVLEVVEVVAAASVDGVGWEVGGEVAVERAVTWGWWLNVAPVAGTVVDEVADVEVVGRLDVVGPVGSVVEVVVPGRPVVVVGSPVVGPVAEVVEVLPAVVVGRLVELGGATGTVPDGTSGWLVLVVVAPGEVVGTMVVEGTVVTDEALVIPVVVVDGVVVVVVGGSDVTDVTDVTDGSDVALPVGKLVVVVGAVPAAADKAGTPTLPVATNSAKIVARDAAPRRVSPLVEIGEEKGISGHPRS